MRRRFAAIAVALVAALAPVAPAQAADVPSAQGTFAFRTANGILPTWERAGLRLSALPPGTAITSVGSTNTQVTLPIVAKLGSSHFAAGGFRITNVKTGDYVSCASPNIFIGGRIVDCVTRDGTNMALLSIKSIGSRRTMSGSLTTTTSYHGIVLRIGNQRIADELNDTLGVAVFSPYVTVANAELSVTTAR